MKVLIVDDDMRRAEALAAYLQSIPDQVEVELADCTNQAKGLLRSKYYDALVLDVVLPKRSEEKGSSANSLSLLDQLSRNRLLRKPEKIVAITAHEDEIESFRAKFEEYCTAVVRASEPSDVWRLRISNAIRYTSSSKVSRATSQREVAVFTIHGIRTYGAWQDRLRALINERTDSVSFYTYKYGYFSAIALLVPPLRGIEVRRLHKRLLDVVSHIDEGRVLVFAHSFGTYLAAQTLRKALRGETLKVDLCLVCSGSVLHENFDWGFARRHANIRVVNDCGSDDLVLYLSKVFALGLGMAGKVGFNGFNDPRFVNRWFAGGHSHYFAGDDFMREHWFPMLTASELQCVDKRGEPSLTSTIGDGVARFLGRIKPAVYLAASALIAFLAWRLAH
jgi:CheY-like chemotaxis protein